MLTHLFGKHEGLTINLGARKFYEIGESNEQLCLESEILNSQFIESFWHKGISMLTAIVGSNGSGKTTLLDLLVHNKECYLIYLAIPRFF